VDLLDVHRGAMTWRRLRVLIQHLPSESSTWTALRNAMSEEELAEQADKGEPEKARWSQLEQLVAASLDATRRVEWAVLAVNTEKAKRPKPPEPTPRPGAKPVRSKPKLTDVQAQDLFRIINGGAA
jgi:murein L,D-transpeptidase YcbB/YkuD